MKPIWTRPQSEVTQDEYKEFYRHISHDWTEPLKVISYKAEGRIEYQALLFVPSQAPYDLYYVASQAGPPALRQARPDHGAAARTCCPSYLRFVRGVVDSPDLPLNVSREMLQQDRHITLIRKGLTKKVLDTLEEMQEKDQRDLPEVLGRVRPGHQGRASPRLREQGAAPGAAALRVLERPGEADHAQGLRRADEGGPERDLLPDRRVARAGGELAAPGGLQGEGDTRCST